MKSVTRSFFSPVTYLRHLAGAVHTALFSNLGFTIVVRYTALAVVLVLSTALLVGLVGFQSLYAFTETATAQRLVKGEAVFTSFAEERNQDIEDLTQWLGKDPSIASYSLTGEPDPRQVLANVLAFSKADFIGIRSKQGEQTIVPPEMAPFAASVSGPPVDGRGGQNEWRSVAGNLVSVSEMPLSDGGSVFAGYFVSDAFADQFTARTGLDLTLFSQGELVATSLRSGNGARIADVPYDQGRLSYAGKGLDSVGRFSIEQDHYKVHYFPIHDRYGRVIATYALSLQFPGIWIKGFSVSNWSYLFLFCLLLIGVIATNLLTKRVIAPLSTLKSAIARMGHGDLATPVVTIATAEMQPLAHEVEEMRRGVLVSHTQLAIEKSLYQGILQSMADGVFTTDEAGNMTSLNPVMLAALGETHDPGGPMSCCGTTVLTDREGRSLCDRACLWLWLQGQGEPVVVKGYRAGPGEQRRDIEVTVTPIKDQNQKTVGLAHVIRDISAQEEVQRLKERFLLSVSHELRTPLSALSSSVELLREEFYAVTAEEKTRILETTQRSIGRLQTLIDNLLDLGSIQAGQFTVNPGPIHLAEPLHEALAISEAVVNGKEQQLELSAPLQMPLVMADGVRVVQVLTNLIANASKYSPPKETIRVHVDDEGEKVRIAVTDHGPGIAPDEKQQVFEYFYRGAAATRREKGFGLGLAMVKGIVEAHKGEVGVTSELGDGTSFWFTLPKESRWLPKTAQARDDREENTPGLS